MLKKAVHIIISLSIVIATSGLTINMHYCQNRLVSTRILLNEKPCCNNKSCCHNESKFLKVDDNATLANTLTFDHIKVIKLSNLLHVDVQANYLVHSNTFYTLNKITHSPPGSTTRLSSICCFLL